MWSHEESVTDRKDRCAIDHYAIEQPCGLGNQLAKEWSSKNLSRIRSASPTCENAKLTACRRENLPGQGNVFVSKLDFAGGNLARSGGQICFTNQAICHSRRSVFLGIVSRARVRETKDLVHVWPAEVAVNKQDAIALLRQRKGIIGAGETFPFVRHSTCEKRYFALGFGTQKRKRSAQIAERFRRRTL